MARRKTQAYTEEFRCEVVKRVEKEGNTTALVVRDLRINAQKIKLYQNECQIH